MGGDRIVIVGASLAGASAAVTLRELGYDGELTLIGEETERPYERPPLSKAVLRGEAAPETTRVHGDGFYASNDI
ncbi:MAG: FAD-dependent oxidoreductase, partial [Acidimicrobiales bacterium]